MKGTMKTIILTTCIVLFDYYNLAVNARNDEIETIEFPSTSPEIERMDVIFPDTKNKDVPTLSNVFIGYASIISAVLTDFDQIAVNFQFQIAIPQIQEMSPNTDLNLENSDSNNIVIAFPSIHVCVAAESELKDLWSHIDDKLEDYEKPAITIIQSKGCHEFEQIKMDILRMRNHFNKLVTANVLSANYNNLKLQYYDKAANLYTKMSNSVLGGTVKDKEIIAELRNEFKSQQVNVTETLNLLEKRQAKINNDVVHLCTLLLKGYRFYDALELFEKLTDESKVRDIIMSLYDHNDSFQVTHRFLELIKDPMTILQGYTALFDLMQNELSNMDLVMMLNEVWKHETPNSNSLSVSISNNLSERYQKNDYKEFYEFIYRRSDKIYTLEVISTFVRSIYNNNSANAEKVLKISLNIFYMNHRLHLLNSLINIMKDQDHTNMPEFLMVLKEVMNIRVEVINQRNQNNKEFIDRIYKNIPDNLRPLMYENVCIQNAKNKEYLHVDNATNLSARRNIFTSVSHKFDKSFVFDVEFRERGRKLLLRNRHYDVYVFAFDGGSSRKLFSYSLFNDPRFYFTIESASSVSVRIKNLRFNEFIYSPNDAYNQNERHVYSKRSVSINSLWVLSTCQFPKIN